MLKSVKSVGAKPSTQNYHDDPELTYTNLIVHLSKLEEMLYVFLSAFSACQNENRYRVTPEPRYTNSMTPQPYIKLKERVSELDIDLSDYEEGSQPLTSTEFRQKAISQLKHL